MNILLQEDYPGMEFHIIKEILDHTKYTHNYVLISMNALKQLSNIEIPGLKNMIPVGSIEFVQTWLSKYHPGVSMTPIEIPECLRKQPFVKRKYEIVPFDEAEKHLPCFVKDVSALKSFSGPIYHKEELYLLDQNHNFLVSEIVDIVSEYRVYIIDGEIQNICNYNGDPAVFPDIQIIRSADILYKLDPTYPKSYSMDVMISNHGTELIEIHPFCAIGLYSSLWGNNLIYAYRDGIDYYIKNCQ